MSEANLAMGPPPIPERGAPTGEPSWAGDGGPRPEPSSSSAPTTAGPFAGELADEPPEVPEAIVRGLLASAGGILGMTPAADPDVEDHWRFTTQELDDLTPPLARIVNRRRELRAALAHGDEAIVLVQLLGYTGRNVVTGAMARTARRQLEQETYEDDQFDPEAGAAAPPGHGGARISADWQQPGGFPAPPGTGVHPPAT